VRRRACCAAVPVALKSRRCWRFFYLRKRDRGIYCTLQTYDCKHYGRNSRELLNFRAALLVRETWNARIESIERRCWFLSPRRSRFEILAR